MIEIVFSESAAGSLAIAAGKGKCVGGVSSAVGISTVGGNQPPSDTEIQRIMWHAEKWERRNWEEAIPLNTDRKDILCFPLALSVGGIIEDEIGEKRQAALQMLTSIYPDEARKAARDMLETAKKNFKELCSRVKNGEAIRVWTSDNPDDACGFCWLMEQLRPIGLENLDLTCVKLPDFHVMPDNTVIIYSGWGEVQPHQWGRFALQEKSFRLIICMDWLSAGSS